MLINQIMLKDTGNCYKALAEDQQMKEIEGCFYSLLLKCSDDIRFDIEQSVNAYMARVLRIAYLQGIKDFAELFIVLKNDVHDILQKYVDV